MSRNQWIKISSYNWTSKWITSFTLFLVESFSCSMFVWGFKLVWFDSSPLRLPLIPATSGATTARQETQWAPSTRNSFSSKQVCEVKPHSYPLIRFSGCGASRPRSPALPWDPKALPGPPPLDSFAWGTPNLCTGRLNPSHYQYGMNE